MTTKDKIAGHLNTLLTATQIKPMGWGSKALYFLQCPESFMFAIVAPFFAAILAVLTALVKAGGIPDDPFFIFLLAVMGGMLFIWGIRQIAGNKIAPHVAAHASQWERILTQCEEMSKHSPEHSSVVQSVMELMDDKRASYQWASELSNLMDQWMSEEQDIKRHNEKMTRIRALKQGHGTPSLDIADNDTVCIEEHEEITSQHMTHNTHQLFGDTP